MRVCQSQAKARVERISRTCEDRNVYIGGKEPGGSEFPEHREAVDKDKESSPEYTPHR